MRFYDRQDESNPRNGTPIGDEKLLAKIMDELASRSPFFCELEGENGYDLLVGIGKPLGCVQHSRHDGDTPYLMAATQASRLNNEHVDFLMANTPSPVPARYCLPFNEVKDIATQFLKTGKRSASVEWEEV